MSEPDWMKLYKEELDREYEFYRKQKRRLDITYFIVTTLLTVSVFMFCYWVWRAATGGAL